MLAQPTHIAHEEIDGRGQTIVQDDLKPFLLASALHWGQTGHAGGVGSTHDYSDGVLAGRKSPADETDCMAWHGMALTGVVGKFQQEMKSKRGRAAGENNNFTFDPDKPSDLQHHRHVKASCPKTT
ncbi:hypothetical protein J1614_011531 [Plenodomus biglobosus]|nr:hypothetical protein J1614_011531 [Plenodomus biglobosus]